MSDGKLSDNFAAASGSGYGGGCPEGVPVEFAILSILAAFAVSFGILYRTFTLETGGRRRRRFSFDGNVDKIQESGFDVSQMIADYFWLGNY